MDLSDYRNVSFDIKAKLREQTAYEIILKCLIKIHIAFNMYNI